MATFEFGVPKVITIENTSDQDIRVQYAATNINTIIMAGDTLKIYTELTPFVNHFISYLRTTFYKEITISMEDAPDIDDPDTPDEPLPEGTVEVSTVEDFNDALSDPSIPAVVLKSDLASDTQITAAGKTTIDGGDKTITVTNKPDTAPADAAGILLTSVNSGSEVRNVTVSGPDSGTGWNEGEYAIKLYDTGETTISNVKLNNANAAMLVQNTSVTINGTVDVSNNEFGGIELEKNSELILNGKLVNSTETVDRPTVWAISYDNVNEAKSARKKTRSNSLVDKTATISGPNANTLTKWFNADKNQYFYFLDSSLVPQEPVDPNTVEVSTYDELVAACKNPDASTIVIKNNMVASCQITPEHMVTIDGENHEVTANITYEDHNAYGAGIRFVAANDGSIVKNLTVYGPNTTPDGWDEGEYAIKIYDAGNITVEDSTFSKANAGALIHGSNVTFNGTIDVSGNEFGGIEVSNGAVLTINGTIVNSTEAPDKPTLWTNDGDTTVGVINGTFASSLTSKHIDEKSQTYYYINPENAVDKGHSANYPFESVKEYNDYLKSNPSNGIDLYLNIDGQTLDAPLGLSNQQNVENPPKLHLNVSNTNFNGSTEFGKQIYVTNIVEMNLDNCNFAENTVSDYGLDVNLCSVKDSVISIKNSTFTKTGQKSAIKISMRKGDTDHPTDITVTEPATISHVTIEGCSFEGNVCDYTIGTTPKGEDTDANTSTGAYAVTITNNLTDVKVKEPYMVDKDAIVPETIVTAMTTREKTAEGTIAAVDG